MKYGSFLLAVLFACRAKSVEPPVLGSNTPPAGVTDAASRSSIADATDVVLVIVDDWTATQATLGRWHRVNDAWQAVGEPWSGVIGRTGAAWGDGLHGHGAPVGRSGPTKLEGDGKSPAGAFALRGAYGYAPTAASQLAYRAVDDAWKCVDDPQSKAYASIVDSRTVAIDWKSAEEMRRTDALYTWVIDVQHNAARTPNAGSCIFMHVWSGPDSTTAGCTAMPEPILKDLVQTLPPSAMFVLLPRAEYHALKVPWRLP